MHPHFKFWALNEIFASIPFANQYFFPFAISLTIKCHDDPLNALAPIPYSKAPKGRQSRMKEMAVALFHKFMDDLWSLSLLAAVAFQLSRQPAEWRTKT